MEYYCKKCRAKLSKQWHAEHPEYWRTRRGYIKKWNAKRKRVGLGSEYRLRSRYGITTEGKRTRLKQQGGRCAICRKPIRRMRDAHTDHPHKGKCGVRGILCQSCNFGLGYFRDSVKNLRGAIKYLKPHKKGE